jgi:hypothetical protein
MAENEKPKWEGVKKSQRESTIRGLGLEQNVVEKFIVNLSLDELIKLSVSDDKEEKYIKNGTTILAALTKNSLILMADSRSQRVSGDFSTSNFVDTTNKIHQLGQYFFEIAGVSHFREIDIYYLVSINFDTTLSLKSNSEKLQKIIFDVLTSYYNNLTTLELDYFHQSIPTWGMLQIFIGGYEQKTNNTPSFTQLEFKIQNEESFYSVTIGNNYTIRFEKGQTGLIDGGAHENIDKLLKNGYNKDNLTIDNLKYLISVEADANDTIGHDYNYVIIKRDSFKLGSSYEVKLP